MIHPLSITSDGLLDKGTKPTLHIAVRGWLRDSISVIDVYPSYIFERVLNTVFEKLNFKRIFKENPIA